MVKLPKPKFELNTDLDIDICSEFLNVHGGGIDFGKHIVELHPNLAKAKTFEGNSRRDEVVKYTKKYYRLHDSELKEKQRIFSEDWKKVEKLFFNGVHSVFGSFPWPDGKYTCYLSIYDCNPRFLEDKTFQVYFHHPQGSNHVTAHEMLHFIFFDYLDKKETEFKNKLDEETIWLLSEFFNDRIFELPEFNEFKSTDAGSYPEVVQFAKKFKSKLNKITDIERFFRQARSVLAN